MVKWQNNVQIKKQCKTQSESILYKFPYKKDDLRTFAADKDPDILLITIMIPKQQKWIIPSSFLNPNGYEFYWNFDITMEHLVFGLPQL